MPMECCYCGKRAEIDRGRTFHKFPWNQPELLQSWLKTMNLGSEFKPLKSMRLCSEHFLEECLIKTGVNAQLRQGSIPSLFGKYKSECVYCSAKKTQGVQRSFHKFPLKNQVLLQKWLLAMGKENYVPNEMSLLCSDHFSATCFRSCKNGASLRLRDSAVPSIFLPVASKDLSVVTKKRKGEPLREIPSAKHLRQDNHCDIVVQSTRECVTTSSMESIVPDEQQQNECMNIDSESIHPSSTNSAATTASNHCRTPTPENDVPSVNTITHDHHYETTPRSTRRKLVASNAKIKNLQEEVRVQKQKINRLYKRISSLQDIVRELRRTKALPESGLDCLESIAESDVSLFLKRYLKNQKKVGEKLVIRKKRQWKSQRENQNLGISREKYPPALRSFAITLHFYSPRAYGFVRRKFCNALPDPATLRSWYSMIDGEPGFTTESFDALKTKVTEAKNANNEVLVALMLDEMGIKKGIQQISNGSVRGYVDLGSDIGTSGLLPLAKDALVIMAVSLNANWKIPVGYFLVNGIDSTTNSGLVTDCLIRLNDIGVKVVSVTLDGPPQHFSTMRLLGANFTMPNPKPFFLHPSTGEKVFVMFDACHMLKLVRNCFGNVKVMKDMDGNLIEWRFVTALAHLQQTEGLRAGNRLRSAHIRYERMKMKVALAAQTMSSSVADSISFCDQTLHLPQFKGSDSTVKFIRCVDHLFDFLNSRNPFARGFKAPLRRSNEIFWRQKISEEIEYLNGIRDVSGRPIWSTPKYVPFVGFVTGVMSVIEIFDMYVKPEGSQLKYLLTYKLSQDHLELFFCAIRSCGGWCPNPTCTQFVSAYKRLLIHHEVAATNGNAEAMDGTRVLSVSSGTSRVQRVDRYDPDVYDAMSNIRVSKKYGLDDQDNDDSSADNFMDEFLKFHGRLPESLSSFSRACIGNIAGWVVRKLVDERRPMVKCEKCRVALFQTSQTRAEFEDNALVEAKTRGGLLFPSTSVVLICQRAEEILRHALNKNKCMTPKESNFPAVACAKVIEDLLQNPEILFPSLNEHIFDDAVEELSNHVYSLAKNVCKTYIKLRLFAATSLASEAAIGTKLRHHMTRQIIWNCQ